MLHRVIKKNAKMSILWTKTQHQWVNNNYFAMHIPWIEQKSIYFDQLRKYPVLIFHTVTVRTQTNICCLSQLVSTVFEQIAREIASQLCVAIVSIVNFNYAESALAVRSAQHIGRAKPNHEYCMCSARLAPFSSTSIFYREDKKMGKIQRAKP